MQRGRSLDLGQIIALMVILIILFLMVFVLVGGVFNSSDPTPTPTATQLSSAHMTMTAGYTADMSPTAPMLLTPIELTAQVTPEIEVTAEVTETPSPVPEPTETITATEAPTETAETTPEVTETESATSTAADATEEVIITPTLQSRDVQSATQTITEAPESTATTIITEAASATATDTATVTGESPTPSPTNTLTHTATSAATRAATDVPPSATPSPIMTNTPIPTAIDTATQTASHTPTRQTSPTATLTRQPPTAIPQGPFGTALAPPPTPTLRGQIRDYSIQAIPQSIPVSAVTSQPPTYVLLLVLEPSQPVDDDTLTRLVAVLEARFAAVEITPQFIGIIEEDKRIRIEIPEPYVMEDVEDLIFVQGLIEFVDFSGVEDSFNYTGEIIQTNGLAMLQAAEMAPEDSEATPEITVTATMPQTETESAGLLHPETGKPFETVLAGDIFVEVSAALDEITDSWRVNFTLNEDAAEIIAEYTRTHIGEPLAIVIDSQVLTVPIIQAEIGAEGIISIVGDEAEVQALVTALRAGYLPVPLTLVEVNFVTLEGETEEDGT